MRRHLSLFAAASILASTAACGGQTAVAPALPFSAPAASQTVRAARPRRATVDFVMRWPSSTAAPRHRGARYVSPSTASAVVDVSGATAFANRVAGQKVAHVAIQAPFGDDEFTIALYDRPQRRGEKSPAGNELGRAEVVQTISRPSGNRLRATIDGIVGSISIAPLPKQPYVEKVPNARDQYGLLGDRSATFAVTARDADGNAIVAPGKAPKLKLAPGALNAVATVTPVAGKPGEYAIAFTAPPAAGSTTAFVATATDAFGNVTTTNLSLAELSVVYVAYGSGGGSRIAAYDARGARVPLASNAFAGVRDPVGLAYDVADRHLFVADAALGEVLAFDTLGDPVAGYTAVSVPNVSAVTYDSDDQTAYALAGTSVTAFTPLGAAPASGPAGFTVPSGQGLTFADDAGTGLLWIGNPSNATVGLYSQAGQLLASYAVPNGATPVALTYDAYGTQNVYLTAQAGSNGYVNDVCNCYGGPFPVTSLALAADAGAPAGLSADPSSGEIYVARAADGTIAPYRSDLASVDVANILTTPRSTGLSQPLALAIVP